ncbi:hypothetical protein CsSME_00005748 [Camellia sinensis var. sinensis]|uniref:uncharacterized protein LOC114274606 n=1 Tax=Camellia sinensis TaxID=4442 RepID=UPI001035F87A|nr:uncharacterized protein LOC114274606 [Camellia sinensis]
MAFVISSNKNQEVKNLSSVSDGRDTNSVTSYLYLKSSSAHSTSEPLDKDVVLRRIRHHKCLNKIRSPFQALLSSSFSCSGQADMVAAHQQRWLEQDDAFSAP